MTSEHEEPIKEFCCMRFCLKADLKKAKLLFFLLKTGKTYPESGNYWTEKFWRLWLK